MQKTLVTTLTCLFGLLISSNIHATLTNTKYHDYRATQSVELQKMQEFHLQQARTKLGNQQLAYAWGDLAYLLCHVPNHHLALKYMLELAPQLKREAELSKFLDKALDLFPEDAIVHALYGTFLAKSGDPVNAAKQVSIALKLEPSLSNEYLPKSIALNQP